MGNHHETYLIFILAIVLVSCSNDDNTTNSESDFLIGTWKGMSFTREDSGVTYDTSNCEDPDIMASYRTFVFIDESNLHYNDSCSGGTGNYGSYSYSNSLLIFDLGDGPIHGNVTVISETDIGLQIDGYGSFIL